MTSYYYQNWKEVAEIIIHEVLFKNRQMEENKCHHCISQKFFPQLQEHFNYIPSSIGKNIHTK